MNILQFIMLGIDRVRVVFLTAYWTGVARLNLKCWGVSVGRGFACKGRIKIRNRGRVCIGNNVIFSSGSAVNFVGCGMRLALQTIGSESQISIGDNVGISSSVIIARDRIEIGDNTLIGGGTAIYDNDFHQLNSGSRLRGVGVIAASPVTIGKNVWVGGHSIILKGVSIGDQSIIGAGSVVTHSIPPGVLAAGNPAKVIKKLDHSESGEPA